MNPTILRKRTLGGRFLTMAQAGIRMMFHDKLKLVGTLFGVVFSVFLTNFQAGTFLQLLYRNKMFIENAAVDLWVTPPYTEQFASGKPLKDTTLTRARAIPGVAWAEPLVIGTTQISLPAGGSEPVTLVGAKGPDFRGGPWNIVNGNRESLLQPNAVIFEDSEREKFGGLNIGSIRELGGHKVQVVGFTYGLIPFAPAYAFAEQTLAREILKYSESDHTFILVGIEPGADLQQVKQSLQLALAETKIMTKAEYLSAVVNYLLRNTGIGKSFGSSTFFAVVVGFVIVALTMFSSVVDNIRQFGTLKAMGANMIDLTMLLLVQSFIYGVMGSSLGLFLATRAAAGVRSANFAINLNPELMFGSLALMTLLCMVASSLSVLRLRSLEPAMVFR